MLKNKLPDIETAINDAIETAIVHTLKKFAPDLTSKELGVKPDDIFAGSIEQGLVKSGEVTRGHAESREEDEDTFDKLTYWCKTNTRTRPS